MKTLKVLKEKKDRIIRKIAIWYLKNPEEIVDPMTPWEIAHWKLEEKLQKKHKKVTIIHSNFSPNKWKIDIEDKECYNFFTKKS